MSLLEPRTTLRNPEPPTSPVMRRRGWWLVFLGFLLPGSAQVVAGNRKLGRFGLIATFTLLFLALVAAIMFFASRETLLRAVGNGFGLLVLEIIVIAYALIWLILGFDTFRLTKLARIKGGGRWGVAVASIVAIVLPVGLAGYAASVIDASRGLLNDVFQATGPTQDPVDGHYTFMLLGADSGDGRMGLRPDTLRVVTVNAETGAATLVGVPRNLMNAPFSEGSPMRSHWPDGFNCGTSDCMANAAYTYGMNNPDLYPDAEDNNSNPGIEATRDLLEGVTGLTIQYYMIVDMHGFEGLIDALGGVEIDVERRIPIGVTGRPPSGYIEPGLQTLDGETALWFARSRSDSSDYDRMDRQRIVMEAVVSQFTPQTLLSSYNRIASAGGDMLQTDIPQSMVGHFTNLAERTGSLPMESIDLVPPLINSENPDFALAHSEVQDAMARAYQNSLPSESPGESGDPDDG
ncbi:LCP family protein [uncultured Agrococcus sp.]|uniref:LCP family protein n=1 Tax=uncultured Agrococcus sp. TaxID=382258 RepID=UPI0025ECBD62|nr:LCP family protein [uncultured Agrococcus sp.]